MRKHIETQVGDDANIAKAKKMVEKHGDSSYSAMALAAMARNSAHGARAQGKHYNFNSKDPKKMAASCRSCVWGKLHYKITVM